MQRDSWATMAHTRRQCILRWAWPYTTRAALQQLYRHGIYNSKRNQTDFTHALHCLRSFLRVSGSVMSPRTSGLSTDRKMFLILTISQCNKINVTYTQVMDFIIKPKQICVWNNAFSYTTLPHYRMESKGIILSSA